MEKFALHYKVLEGDIQQIKEELAVGGCNIDELDNWGYAPLHWAVVNMQYEIVMLLLGAGANPDVISSVGLTPQKIAYSLEFYDIEQLFFQCTPSLQMAS